jgi:DNA-binding transcriptional MerR regulator
MKRVDPPLASVSSNSAQPAFSEGELSEIEARHPDGLSTQEIVELFAARGERLSEATFRKYVQLGLLPRSVRVARKGQGRGSQGRYPADVVRQLDAVRLLIAQGFTIQHIQREFISLRGDIEALSRQLSQVLSTFDQAIAKRTKGVPDEFLGRAMSDVREIAGSLVERLRAVEQRLAMRARMARAAV